ncbi:hypothetical protein KFU94_28050 [Chloroflexi bacterium TSY]|nr:hypothetical protein [Chloroflexi bacterium TSY]
MHQSKARNKALVEAIPDAMVHMRRDGVHLILIPTLYEHNDLTVHTAV